MIHKRDFDGYQIETKSKIIIGCNLILAEAGTNGLHGGDGGHGCRTYIRIAADDGAGMRCNVEEDGSMIIILAGDSELESIIKALRFIANRLTCQMEKIKNT